MKVRHSPIGVVGDCGDPGETKVSSSASSRCNFSYLPAPAATSPAVGGTMKGQLKEELLSGRHRCADIVGKELHLL